MRVGNADPGGSPQPLPYWVTCGQLPLWAEDQVHFMLILYSDKEPQMSPKRRGIEWEPEEARDPKLWALPFNSLTNASPGPQFPQLYRKGLVGLHGPSCIRYPFLTLLLLSTRPWLWPSRRPSCSILTCW